MYRRSVLLCQAIIAVSVSEWLGSHENGYRDIRYYSTHSSFMTVHILSLTLHNMRQVICLVCLLDT